LSSNSVGETVVVGWTDGREEEVVVVVVEVEGGGGISTIPSSSSSSSSILPVSEVGVAVKNPTSMDMFPSGSAVGLGALVMMMMAVVGVAGGVVVEGGVGGEVKKSSPIDMLKLTSMSKGMGLVLLEDDLLLFEVDLEPLDDDLEDLPLLEDFLEHFAACCWCCWC